MSGRVNPIETAASRNPTFENFCIENLKNAEIGKEFI
jgi:hypothetical protein